MNIFLMIVTYHWPLSSARYSDNFASAPFETDSNDLICPVIYNRVELGGKIILHYYMEGSNEENLTVDRGLLGLDTVLT